MPLPNPYEPPESKPNTGLWPRNRQRRERMVYGTVRSWLLFGLRAIIFLAVVIALLILSRPAQP